MSNGGDDLGRAHARVGQWLTREWRLTKLIGIGGTSAVYEATGSVLAGVAIKVLHERLCSSAELRGCFIREAPLMQRIGHPGVVKVIHHGTADDGAPFLVMELLIGETAEQRRVRAGGRLPESDVLAIADQVLGVLGKAHELGVVHRDVSPSNLFMVRDGSLRVLDFGISSPFESPHWEEALTRSGEVSGTLAYMSPEQALGAHRSVDQRSDIYSLGATLFRLLTGKWVHHGADAHDLRAAAISVPARSLASLLPAAHLHTIHLVDGALRYERSARWQTAREMQDACRTAMDRLTDRTGAGCISDEVLGAEVCDARTHVEPPGLPLY